MCVIGTNVGVAPCIAGIRETTTRARNISPSLSAHRPWSIVDAKVKSFILRRFRSSDLWFLVSELWFIRLLMPSTGSYGELLPLMRPLFRRPQQPPLRVRVRCPLMPSFRPDDSSSFRCPFIRPQRLSLREPHLCPELHPALASLQPPFRQPQQPSHPRLFRATQQRPLRSSQRPSLRPMLRANQQRPFRPLLHRTHRLGAAPRRSERPLSSLALNA